jgi:hypothetical protein
MNPNNYHNSLGVAGNIMTNVDGQFYKSYGNGQMTTTQTHHNRNLSQHNNAHMPMVAGQHINQN